MSEIAKLERRITAALERIGKGLGELPQPVAGSDADKAEIERLREALEVEKAATAQLNERLRAVKEREAQHDTTLEARVEQLSRQLDTQGLELQRMRKTTIQLRENLRALRETRQDSVEAHLINKAMLAELDALRATRAAETAEMEEILAELAPIVEEKADA